MPISVEEYEKLDKRVIAEEEKKSAERAEILRLIKKKIPDVLRFLKKNKDKTYSAEELMQQIYGKNIDRIAFMSALIGGRVYVRIHDIIDYLSDEDGRFWIKYKEDKWEEMPISVEEAEREKKRVESVENIRWIEEKIPDVLKFLKKNKDKTYSAEELMQQIYGKNIDRDTFMRALFFGSIIINHLREDGRVWIKYKEVM
ncbi:MAG: hypothetical protein KAV25_09620 [Methanophagales archaeon]|nr:hypothetical protein [Methanophagales archaeon]